MEGTPMLQLKACLRLLWIVGALALAAPAQAITEEKEKDIKILLGLMGISSMGEQMADMLVTGNVSQEKKRYPGMPKKVEFALSKAMRDVVLERIHEMDRLTVPTYDKYYTHAEITQLIAFFSSPVGRKYSAVLGPMTQELLPIAQDWAKRIAPIMAKRAEQELRRYGYK